jgi:hypothetical protein
MLNERRTTQLGETPEGHIEGVVRLRGFAFEAAGREFKYHRFEPEAVVVRGEDDLRRIPLSSEAGRLPALAIPVAAYVAARLLLRRRRRR